MKIVVVVNLREGALYDAYCGRATAGQKAGVDPRTPGADGFFGNPFKINVETLGTRVAALQQFQSYFHTRIVRDPEFERRVEELSSFSKGSVLRLACWCKPKPCHADIIAEYLERRS